VVNETLHQVRRHLARFWLTMPPQSLETAYRSELGNVFRALLNSGVQNDELSSEDEALKQQLTQAGVGLSQPNSLNALMGAMLFYPADQMKVRDAKSRLPAWVYGDYVAVFESDTSTSNTATASTATVPTATAALPTVAQTPAPQPVPTPAPPALETIPELPPVHQQDPNSTAFTNRAIGCANLYYIDPSDQEIVLELRQIRHHLARHLAGTPPQQLEALYRTNVGDAYRALLKSDFRGEPLSQEEASIKQQLTQASTGLTRPDAINALMGVMLYTPNGQLKVRDAQTRLPAWLYGDYMAAFEVGSTPTPAATPATPSPVATSPMPVPAASVPAPTPIAAPAALPAPAATPYMPELAVDSPAFLNRLLGSVNLYMIDPTDRAICAELRQLRRRFSDHWLTIESTNLETVYQADLGRGFKLLLHSGFQKEPLDSDDDAYKQALTQVAVGLTAPKAINAMMVAMLYFPTDKLRVQAAEQRLPGWLLPDYLRVFEGKQVADPNALDVQPPSQAFIDRLTAAINRYQANTSDAATIAEVRRLRHALAQYWISLEPAQLQTAYASPLGNAQRLLLSSGFTKLEKTPLDRDTFKQISGVLAQGMTNPKAMNYFAAAMLYCAPANLQVANAASILPAWLLADYNRFFTAVAA
jgi:hypothetical protein